VRLSLIAVLRVHLSSIEHVMGVWLAASSERQQVVKGERSEARGERSEARGQRSKARGERSEARGERSETRGERSEARGQRSEARGQRSEARGQRSEARGERRGLSLPSRDQRPPLRAYQSLLLTTGLSLVPVLCSCLLSRLFNDHE
jgi:chromosome segregation ATPase